MGRSVGWIRSEDFFGRFAKRIDRKKDEESNKNRVVDPTDNWHAKRSDSNILHATFFLKLKNNIRTLYFLRFEIVYLHCFDGGFATYVLWILIRAYVEIFYCLSLPYRTYKYHRKISRLGMCRIFSRFRQSKKKTPAGRLNEFSEICNFSQNWALIRSGFINWIIFNSLQQRGSNIFCETHLFALMDR